MSDDRHRVAIIGTGTMGAGIAQVAAGAGWTVALRDVDESTVRNAISGIARRFDRLVEKGKLTSDERDAAVERLHYASDSDALRDCELLIEVVVERLDVKTKVLRELIGLLRPEAIIATNTSSLSVSAIGASIGQARRTVGMHFFNPAPLMKLVEVIAGQQTAAAVVDRTAEIATSWGKKVARAADVPGFIVNHVARPYYLEAFRIVEDGYADPLEIDDAMKSIGGFRMGPFELTDLIGHDVNTATTRQVWEGVGKPALLEPNRLQEAMVAQGHLGRKTGRGVYDYRDAENPTIAIEFERRELAWTEELRRSVRDFARRGGNVDDETDDLSCYVFARILKAIFAQARAAHDRGVASRTDIDTAMKYGVNYPRGPFEWMGLID